MLDGTLHKASLWLRGQGFDFEAVLVGMVGKSY
jgi:hypothetical protein